MPRKGFQWKVFEEFSEVLDLAEFIFRFNFLGTYFATDFWHANWHGEKSANFQGLFSQ